MDAHVFCPHLFQPLNPGAPRTGGPGYCSGRTWSILISSGPTLLKTAASSPCGSQESSYSSGTSASPGGPQGRECLNSQEGWVQIRFLGQEDPLE